MNSTDEQWLRRQEAVESALKDRDDERRRSQKVTRRNRLTPCCKKGEFEAAIYGCCTPLALGFSALVIPFIFVFLSSNEEMVERFHPAKCHVTAFNETGTYVGCGCNAGRFCVSEFPCFILFTNVTYNDGQQHTFSSQIYNRMEDVKARDKKCSYKSCYKDKTFNNMNVKNFVMKYSQIGMEIDCYYDVSNPRDVIIVRPVIVPLRWDFFPFILCIGIIASICWFVILLVCCLYGCTDCCIYVKENNKFCPQRQRGDSYNI